MELLRLVLLMILELLLVIYDFRVTELNSTARKHYLPFMKFVNCLSEYAP